MTSRGEDASAVIDAVATGRQEDHQGTVESSPPRRLSELATTSVAAIADERILLVPVGSTEQHGPHLPLDTDTRIAVVLADRAAASQPGRLLVAPPVCYGASGEHAGFAGTLSIGTEALTTVLVEIGRSADAFACVVFVNGHGGNVAALRAAVDRLRSEGRDVHAWSWSVPGGDAHAGRTETSMMLAIDPATVDLQAARVGRTEPIVELIDELVRSGVRALSPNGVLGDPTGASAAEGDSLLAQLVDALVDHVDQVASMRGAPRSRVE